MDNIDLESSIQSLTPGALYRLINNGTNYSDIIWKDTKYNKPTEEEINSKKTELLAALPMDILRNERNTLLEESDIYVLPDFPHASEDIKQAWLTYRQTLRDLPINNSSPILNDIQGVINVTFPVAPNGMHRI